MIRMEWGSEPVRGKIYEETSATRREQVMVGEMD